MRRALIISFGLATMAGVAGCETRDSGDVARLADARPPGASGAIYEGIETRLLEGDLVSFRVRMQGAQTPADVDAYAACAAARYALIRGYGFARHVRTNFEAEDNSIVAEAVYTISPSLPRGLRTIDAEVTVSDCGERGIPTV